MNHKFYITRSIAFIHRRREGDLLTIGEKLKKAREEKHLTLKEVQENIKIRTRYLEALETDQYDVIPGEAYVRAFIKGYSNFLDLNYIQLLEQYEVIQAEEKREFEESQENNELHENTGNIVHNKKFISSIIIAIIVVVVAFLIYNIFLLNESRNDLNIVSNNDSLQTITKEIDLDTQTDDGNIDDNNSDVDGDKSTDISTKNINEIVNKQNLDISSADSLTDDTFGEKNNISNEVDSDIVIEQKFMDNNESRNENKNLLVRDEIKEKNIDIIVSETSWIQIHIDNEKVYEGTLNTGDNRSYSYSDNISMKIGNAAGITVRKGNRVLGPWGEQGEVIKKTIED